MGSQPARDVTATVPVVQNMPARYRDRAFGPKATGEDRAELDRILDEADQRAMNDLREGRKQFQIRTWEESLARYPRYRAASLGRLWPQQDPEGVVSGWLQSGTQTLILTGSFRRGKTHAAMAVGAAAADDGLRVAAWKVSHLMKATLPSRDDADSILETVTDVDILILDDLGRERRTEWTIAQVTDIIDARIDRELRTVITTNMSEEDLSTAYGDLVMYRLAENFTAAPIEGDVLKPPPLF